MRKLKDNHSKEAEKNRALWNKLLRNVFEKWESKTFAQKVKWIEDNV